MACVITDPCVGTCDAACVEVCPVDCIHGPVPLEDIELVPREERGRRFPTLQLYIDPDSCICCAACVPQCPVEAIFEESDVPVAYRASIEVNAAFFKRGNPRLPSVSRSGS
jgi:NAD-dependent dihydropyrimidine dehydrogenase PreA subunit